MKVSQTLLKIFFFDGLKIYDEPIHFLDLVDFTVEELDVLGLPPANEDVGNWAAVLAKI